jgi:disulfide bond formation protein DsbB
MDTDAVILFLALLAVACQVAVVAAGIAWFARRPPELGREALALGCAIAVVATLGSLYLSEVANFLPCRLCWVQRGFMYPLGPILGVASFTGHRLVRVTAAAMAALGAAVSMYHVLLERFPSLESDVCEPENPCTLIWVEKFGYLTIPGMALSGFAAILVLLVVSARSP